MSRYNGGWYSTPRAAVPTDEQHPLAGDLAGWAIYCYLRGAAEFRPRSVKFGKALRELAIGEVLVTQRELEALLGVDRMVLRRALERLEALKLLVIKESKPRAGTIVAFPDYYESKSETLEGQGRPIVETLPPVDNEKTNQFDLGRNDQIENAGEPRYEPIPGIDDVGNDQFQNDDFDQLPTNCRPIGEPIGALKALIVNAFDAPNKKQGNKGITTTTPNPSAGGGAKVPLSIASARVVAGAIVAKLEGAIRDKLEEADARARIGERGWSCLVERYPAGWSQIRHEYISIWNEKPQRAERTFKQSIASLLAAPTDDESGPTSA